MDFLIQPSWRERDKWEKFAREEGLTFEALEPSMPQALMNVPEYEEGRSWYRNCGLVSSLHGVFIDVNPASGDPLLAELSKKRFRESCGEALLCGAKSVVFHSTCAPVLRGGYLDNWVNKTAEFLASLAGEYNFDILIENSFDIDPEPMFRVLEIVKNGNVGVCLDVGHAFYSGTPVKDWFDALGDRIMHLHLSDNMGRFDDHMTLGTGRVDWFEADRLWHNLGREIPATLEVGSRDSILLSLNYLRKNNLFCTKE